LDKFGLHPLAPWASHPLHHSQDRILKSLIEKLEFNSNNRSLGA